VAATWPIDANVSTGENPERVRAVLTSTNLLSLLGTPPFLGRDFRPEDAGGDIGYVAILSFDAWQRLFHGDPGALGQTIRLDDDPITVVGVMPRDFEHPGESRADPVSVWMPISFAAGNRFDNRGSRVLKVFARLRPGVSMAATRADLRDLARGVAEEHPEAYPPDDGWSLRAQSLYERIVGDVRPTLLVLLAAVGFVLLAACTNVAALLLARGQARSTEFAIRVALGGGRAVIVRRLFLESLLLALLGAAAGLAVAHGGLLWLHNLTVGALPRADDTTLNGPVLMFTAVASLVTSVAFGLFPAVQASRTDPYSLLRTRDGSDPGRARVRRALTTAQVVVSVTLLVGAGILTKSFAGMMRRDPGFDPDSVVALQTWLPVPNDPARARFGAVSERFRFADVALRTLESIPGVERAAVVSVLPFRGLASIPFAVDVGRLVEDGALPTVEFRQVSDAWFDVMGIPLLQGRGLEPGDDADNPPVVAVDRTLADRWLGSDAVGHRLLLGGSNGRSFEVVGVVGNVRDRALDVAPRPHVYLSYRQSLGYALSFVLEGPARKETLASAARAAIRRVDPDQPVFGVATMREIVLDSLARERLLTGLVGLFAGLALVLAAIGIYGVATHAVRRRRREIGIRMALGAAAPDVVGLTLRETARIAALGIGLGLLGGPLAARLARGVLHGTSPWDPAVLGLVATFAAAVAILAGLVPAVRAIRVDPVETLRSE
jgi:predicted permease